MKITLFLLSLLGLSSCDPAIECTGTCDGKRIRNIDNGGEYFTIEYDSDNQAIRYEKALSEFATFDYQASQVVKVYDGIATTYTLDADGKVISSATPSVNASYSYTYDIDDQVIETTEIKMDLKLFFTINGLKEIWSKPNMTDRSEPSALL